MLNSRFKIKKTQFTLKTNYQSTHSGALIGSNDDLITEILHRLPAKSILRFKSVSKHWQSLLSHRHFTLSYDNLLISPGLFVRNLYIPFDVENQTPPPFRRLDFYPDRRGIKIVQSCNELLLCCSNKGTESTRKYYVFNPTTKQFVVIPSVIGGPKVSKRVCFMGMAFHQTDCIHYKVVCIHHANNYGKLLQIQIYLSDTQNWKITNQSFEALDYMNNHMCITYGIYSNGAIHRSTSCLDMIYFKVDVERLENLLLPNRVASPDGYHFISPRYFGESRGHLQVVERVRREKRLHLNVFEILSDYSGWFVKYKVDLVTAYPEMVNPSDRQDRSKYWFEIFDVVRGEEEDDMFMVVRTRERVIRYNILNKSFVHIFDLPNILFHRGIGQENVYRYTESISSF